MFLKDKYCTCKPVDWKKLKDVKTAQYWMKDVTMSPSGLNERC